MRRIDGQRIRVIEAIGRARSLIDSLTAQVADGGFIGVDMAQAVTSATSDLAYKCAQHDAYMHADDECEAIRNAAAARESLARGAK